MSNTQIINDKLQRREENSRAPGHGKGAGCEVKQGEAGVIRRTIGGMDDGEEGKWTSERGKKMGDKGGACCTSRPWSSVRYARLGSRCYTARAGPDYSVFTTVISRCVVFRSYLQTYM